MGLFRKLLDQINRALEGQAGPSSSSNTPPFPPGPTCSSSPDMSNESSLLCHNPEHISSWHLHELNQYRHLCSGKECSWIVPFAGNSFLNSSSTGNGPAPDANRITEAGLVNWNTADITPSLFFHCDQPGAYLIGLRLHVPQGHTSTIRVSLMTCTPQEQCQAPQVNQVFIEGVSQGSYQILPCGKFHVGQAGYIKLALSGVQKSGAVFADVSHAILIPEDDQDSSGGRQKRSLETPSPDKSLVKFVDSPDDFYFGRRGPSVHLNYRVPPAANSEGFPRQVEYFYNEVLVPPGNDVIGSYFCAIGFNGGYFGIQVNSATERRILFSIWSAYSTDNPNEIPQDYKVVPIRRGSKNMHVGEFGDEGSGGQSYLRYAWKSNTVYKFLVQARPLDEDTTMFSAWFSDSNEPGEVWKLIASFRKPKVSTYLQGLYSFSENFIPEMGHFERKCLFGNQWAWDNLEGGGRWVEVTKATFTADATAQKENRKDVAGGVVQSYGWNDGSTNRFYLRNCGFFSDRIDPGQEFCRSACGCTPSIDFSRLP